MLRMILTLALLAVVSSFVPLPSPATIQNIPKSEVSGAVNIGGDRVLLVADEGYDVQMVSDAEATFKAGDNASFVSHMKAAIPLAEDPESDQSKKIMNDLEDIAWDDKGQAAFLITSHSRNKPSPGNPTGEEKPARYKLARLQWQSGTFKNLEVAVLKEALKKKFGFVGPAMERKTSEGGEKGAFNIEGLAFRPADGSASGSLLLGLRSPTRTANCKPCAIVLTLKNPHALFSTPAAAPEFEDQLNCLQLDGLAIRGMTYDATRNGFWIVAGRSADPDPEPTTNLVLSSLWFWDADKPYEQPQKAAVDLSGLVNLEGVSLLKRDGKEGLLLISDDGKGKPSRYLWIPSPTVACPAVG